MPSKQLRALVATGGAAAVALVGTMVMMRGPDPVQPPETMEQTSSIWQGDLIHGSVAAFPINVDRSKFRVNLALETLPLPDASWRGVEWRQIHRVDPATNTFAVRVWRRRNGLQPVLVDTLRMPFKTHLQQFPVNASVLQGDVLMVEYLPALLSATEWPRLSTIDAKSGDQHGVPPAHTTMGHVMAGGKGRVP